MSKEKHAIIELVEDFEAVVGEVIGVFPNEHSMNRGDLTIEKAYGIEDNNNIVLLLKKSQMTVVIDLERGKVNGFGIEGKEPSEEVVKSMRELGEKVKSVATIFHEFG